MNCIDLLLLCIMMVKDLIQWLDGSNKFKETYG